MYILIIPSAYPHAYNFVSGNFFHDHARSLLKVGIKVVVLAVVPVSVKDIWRQRRSRLKDMLGFRQYQKDGVNILQVDFISIPYLRRLNSLRRMWIARRFYTRLLEEFGYPDIVHLHAFMAGEIALDLKRRFSLPFVYTAHYSAIERNLINPYQNKLLTRIVKEAGSVTAVSSKFAAHLERVTRRKFLVTGNPVYLPGNADRSSEFNRKSNNALRICALGGLNHNKGFHRLIAAFKEFIKVYPESQLVIAGDGSEKPALIAQVATLDISDAVEFPGFLRRDQVAGLVSNSDFLVVSSEYETFGVVAIEAFYSGKPVVATKCGGPEDIVTERWLGELVDISIEGLLEGMLKVAKGLSESRFDPERISRYALEKYSLLAIGQQMSTVYSEIE